MKNFLLCMLAGVLLFSCSDKEELSKPITPEEEESTVEVVDSLFYSLDVDGFELVAATNSHTSLFFQTDTTFAFKCLFDSCGTNRLVAYCDSTGLVERIVADNQVINVLHHQDKKKLDIFLKDTNNKLSWIKDLKSPYKNLSSRAKTGDVPYSAINIVNKLSYAVYTIINTSEVQKAIPSDMVYWKFIGKYQKLETYNMKGTVVFKLITQALGLKYQLSISNHFGTIVSVMSDYTNWVKKQLYGNALPVLRTYASFAGGYVTDYNDRDKDKDKDEKFWDTNMTLNAYIDGGDSLKNELRVGIMVAKEGDKLNAFNFLQNKSMEYSSQTINYPCSFTNLPSGQKYKFRPYLAPASTSKYLTGLRGLLDYYQYNFSKDYRLLETKAQLKSKEDNQATIKLSVENADISIKMGIIYGEHSNLLQHDFKKIEFEPTFEGGLFTNNFEKEVKLEELKSGYTYYMPYIIYNDNVLNHHIYATDTMVSDVITEKDYIFYGKKDSVEIINNPITGDAKLNEKTLTFNGSYDIEIKDVIEYGICYSKDNKEFKIDNSSVLKANAHQDGEFKVDINININEDDKNFYYRAFIKVKEKYYYGDVRNFIIIGIIHDPITEDATTDEDFITFKGSFDTKNIEKIKEYGICYSKEDKEITIENAFILKANSHQEGKYTNKTIINKGDISFYYRAYIKTEHGIYYGIIKKHEILKAYYFSTLYSKCGEDEKTEINGEDLNYDKYMILNNKKYIIYDNEEEAWNYFLTGKFINEDCSCIDYWSILESTEDNIRTYCKRVFDDEEAIDAHLYYTYDRIYDDELRKKVEYVITHKQKSEEVYE